MYKSIYTYAWDLADEGLDEAIPHFRDAGLNTVTMAVSYHAGKFLRPHGRSGKVYFPDDGTIYFRPRSERYGHIQPIVNPLIEEQDVLADLRDRAPDMDRFGWTLCTHNTRLGERYPECTVRNAYGDAYIYNLCPANPDVRGYVVAMCTDVAERYELSGVALETPGYMPFEHDFHHEFYLTPLTPWAKWLLGLCFCEYCLGGARQAGIDADRLQATAREWLDRYLADDIAPPDDMGVHWWLADLVDDPEWATFLRWRCEVVAGLVAEIRSSIPAETRLTVLPTVQRPTAASWSEGSNLRLLAEAADALEVPAYEPSAARAHLDGWDVRRRAGPDARLHFILRPTGPDVGGGTETAEAVRKLLEVGMEGVAFYNYGHMRLANLGHVREALALLDGK